MDRRLLGVSSASFVKVFACALVVPVLSMTPVSAHDTSHGPPVRPLGRIDPRQVYPFAVIAGGGGHFHVLEVMPGDTRIFAGTHLGLFLSKDRGLTWSLAATRFSGVDVHALARNSRTGALYTATHGHGILVTRDQGVTWSDDSSGLPGRDVHALALDPSNPDTIYVWSVGHGLFLRRGASRTWQHLAGATALTDVESLAVHPEAPTRLYAGTARGVWTSEGGRRWHLPRPGLRRRTAGVAVVPRVNTVLAATFDGVFAGDDDASRWKPVEQAPSWWGPIVGFAFTADRPDTVFAVAHEGPVVTRPLEGGAWTPLASSDGAAASAALRSPR